MKTVERDQWIRMVERYSDAHPNANPPPCDPPRRTPADVGEDSAEESDEEGTGCGGDWMQQKREGQLRWANTMLGLCDIEAHYLAVKSAARMDSTDPAAQLHEKRQSIEAEKKRKADEAEAKSEHAKSKQATAKNAKPTARHPAKNRQL